MNANDTYSFKLEEHYKVISTFSFEVNLNATVHLLTVKNRHSKKYEILPFLMDIDQKVERLKSISFKALPEIISYHWSNEVLTLITFHKNDLMIIDFSFNGGENTIRELKNFGQPQYVFTKANLTAFLVPNERRDKITITTVYNSNSVESNEIIVSDDLRKNIRRVFRNQIEVINEPRYAKNSSISRIQAYYEDHTFYFVDNLHYKDYLSVITIHQKEKNLITTMTISNSGVQKPVKRNSYIKDGKIFALFLNKSEFEVHIYDLLEAKRLKTLSLQSQLSKNPNIRSRVNLYLKESNKMKNTPTIVINETVSGNYEITVDFVNKNDYRNDDSMWWFHNWWFWQQQYLTPNPIKPKFGPNVDIIDNIPIEFYKNESVPMTFVLNKMLVFQPYLKEKTKYLYIDKEKYAEILKDNERIRHQSAGFLPGKIHYICSNTKEEVIYIVSRSLDNFNTTDTE